MVVSNIFDFHPCPWKWSNLTSIFFRWVETTNQISLPVQKFCNWMGQLTISNCHLSVPPKRSRSQNCQGFVKGRKTTHHRVHQKICFYSNWNFGKSSPPNPPFFFGKHPKQIYFRERNSGLNRVTCFWQQKWLSREYHSRSELDSRWSELSWRAAFAGMFWTWPRRGWFERCVLACLGFNHKSFGGRNVHHDTFTWVFGTVEDKPKTAKSLCFFWLFINNLFDCIPAPSSLKRQ